MIIGRDGRLTGVASARIASWFGTPEQGADFGSWMAPHNESFGEWFALGWEGVEDGFLPLEVILDQLPSTMQVGDRQFAVEYRPMVKAGEDIEEMQRLLVVFSDRTEAVAMERERREQEELVAMFTRVQADRYGFLAFFRDGGAMVARLQIGEACEAETARIVHTIKGNCGVMGVGSVARVCHEVEQAAADEARGIDTAGIEQVAQAWRGFSDRVADFVQLDEDGPLAIDREDYSAVYGAVESRLDHDRLRDMLDKWTWDDVGRRLETLGEKGADLARRLGKGDVQVKVDTDGLRVPPGSLDNLFSALVHVVRNAADHGIESPEERVAQGKPAAGTLTLRGFEKDGTLCIEATDDGQGICWDKVATKMAEKGHVIESDKDLQDALFFDGLSTRDACTETSGRGVGMAAVKEAVEALGGTIEVDSTLGRGTVFRHHIPMAMVLQQAANGPMGARAVA